MKMPVTPPRWDALSKEMRGDEERFLRAFQAGSASDQASRYVHWDKLRHLAPPEGLDHRAWWYGLKLHRLQKRRPLELLDRKGRPFGFLTELDIIARHLHGIDTQMGGRIQGPEPLRNERSRNRYLISSLMEEAICSSQIEGAATTRRKARDLLKSGKKPKDKSERMILNNYGTMQYIRSCKDEKLSPELVLDFHRRITLDTLEDAPNGGRLRQQGIHDELAVLNEKHEVMHTLPDARELPERLEKMCRFANRSQEANFFLHPAIRAILLHFWLAYDHPFVDGNGRLARSLFYWSMLRSGYWLFEFVSISTIIRKAKAKYGMAFLYSETDDNDVTYFILHQLDVINRAIGELHAYLERKTRETENLEARLRQLPTLNHRQKALVQHALRHAGQVYTIESHQNSHGVAHQTARTDLYNLAERGFLESWRVGRVLHYRGVADLEERLR